MESTGKYWAPVFNLLEDEINVTIANPKWVNDFVKISRHIFLKDFAPYAASLRES